MSDLVHLAIERAVRAYNGDSVGVIFNNAGFAQEFAKLAGINTPPDGNIIRAILSGRDDIIELGKSHYQIRPETKG